MMIIEIKFKNDNNLAFDLSYQHKIQSMIYKCLDEHLSKSLHEQDDKRNYKFFTFSKLMSDEGYVVKDNKLFFKGDSIKLKVASLNDNFITSLCNGLLTKPVYIGRQQINVQSIKKIILDNNCITDNLIIYSLSPVIVKSTLYDKTGKPEVYYYSPFEHKWQLKVFENLQRKYYKYYNKHIDISNFKFYCLKASKCKVLKYKDVFYKGYDVVLKCENIPKDIIIFMLHTGIGEKNSQGFGFIDIKNKTKE